MGNVWAQQTTHLLSALTKLSSANEVASVLKYDALYQLFTRLVKYLLDDFVEKLPASAKDSLNSVFCKVVKRAHPNAICRVLFNTFLLHINGLIKNDENTEEHYKCYDIVQKLIWRVAKGLREQINLKKVNQERLLADINQFLENFDAQQWSLVTQRLRFTNSPWQTVKAILSLLIHIHKEKIFSRLTLIPNSTQSPIYIKILHSLQNSPAIDRRLLEDKFNSSQENLASSPKTRSRSISPVQTMDDQLDRIFQRIRHGSTMHDGVQELKEFRLKNPQAEEAVKSRLAKLSHGFQMYIRRFALRLDGDYLSRPMSASSDSLTSYRSLQTGSSTPTSTHTLKTASTTSPSAKSITTPTSTRALKTGLASAQSLKTGLASARSLKTGSVTPTIQRGSMISSPKKSVFRSTKSKSLAMSLSMFEDPDRKATPQKAVAPERLDSIKKMFEYSGLSNTRSKMARS
ncbi:hypothetical protein K493DRAFT_61374 [Basidiobolus meristosporus CBS 931.73]|uniref:Uncharacterized protein n=1 Tax=Basidiobolus meristosporus CBS 931.73 TaxID=1314790 RepID=A0A1Y1XWM9_9FUNG|nr:hypothetical protein K493DRAFT_61374 [Basidiobolus meristosporus CBS 931.73]|eukprot:ORX90159.1 hypothetical protein K493DRAFT_61374 [Basidiobolus meristosporus CBS 931.73]